MSALTGGGFFISSALGVGQSGSCGSFPTTNNREASTFNVRVPVAAHSGDYAVFSIHSFLEDPGNACGAPLDDDLDHQWLVGVYVP
jgi:hypothetical protein